MSKAGCAPPTFQPSCYQPPFWPVFSLSQAGVSVPHGEILFLLLPLEAGVCADGHPVAISEAVP